MTVLSGYQPWSTGSLMLKVMSRVTVNSVGAPESSTSPPTLTISNLWISEIVLAARARTVRTASSIESPALPESLMVLVIDDIAGDGS